MRIDRFPAIRLTAFLTLILAGCRSTDATTDLAAAATDEAVKPYRSCVFGESLDELRRSADFSIVEKGDTKRVGRMAAADGAERQFKVSEFTHKATGNVFTAFATQLGTTDDGATAGWLEAAATGEIVAEIGGNEIFSCDVDTVNVARLPQRADSTCAFGEHLGDLENSRLFSKSSMARPARGARPKLTSVDLDAFKTADGYSVREYKHLKTGQDYLVYTAVAADAEEGRDGGRVDGPLLAGALIGWIEQKTSGRVVGEIVGGWVRRCTVLGNGTIAQVSDETLLSDCVVAKEWDDLDDDQDETKDAECQPTTNAPRALK